MPLGSASPVLPDSVTADVRRFPGIKRLASEYATNFAALAPFFAGDPGDDEAWRAAIAASQGESRRPPPRSRSLYPRAQATAPGEVTLPPRAGLRFGLDHSTPARRPPPWARSL